MTTLPTPAKRSGGTTAGEATLNLRSMSGLEARKPPSKHSSEPKLIRHVQLLIQQSCFASWEFAFCTHMRDLCAAHCRSAPLLSHVKLYCTCLADWQQPTEDLSLMT